MSELKANLIRACCETAAGKKDHRPELKGIHIENQGSRVRYSATDGFCLFTAWEDGHTDLPESLILPLGPVKTAVKGKEPRVELSLTGSEYCLGNVNMPALNDSYPDISKFIPESPTGEPAQYDFALLTRLRRAFNLAAGLPAAKADAKKHPILYQSGEKSPGVMVSKAVDAVGVVMPLTIERCDWDTDVRARLADARD